MTPAAMKRRRTERRHLGRRERIEARVSPEQKAFLQRAVALEGRTVTDFLVGSAQTAALETIRRHEQIILSARDSARFVEALLNPPAPNERFREAARLHRALVEV